MLEKPKSSNAMLVIVSAVMILSILAAAAIISAAGGLERMSVQTLGHTERHLWSTIVVFQVMGEDATGDGKFEHLDIFVNLGSASRHVNWSSTRIIIDIEDFQQTLTYAGPGIKSPNESDYYAVHYLHRNDVSGLPDHMYLGDRAKIRVNALESIGADKRIFIQIIPESGNICRISFNTPQIMTSRRVEIYP